MPWSDEGPRHPGPDELGRHAHDLREDLRDIEQRRHQRVPRTRRTTRSPDDPPWREPARPGRTWATRTSSGRRVEPHEQVPRRKPLRHALAPLDGDDGVGEVGVEVEVVELGDVAAKPSR